MACPHDLPWRSARLTAPRNATKRLNPSAVVKASIEAFDSFDSFWNWFLVPSLNPKVGLMSCRTRALQLLLGRPAMCDATAALSLLIPAEVSRAPSTG